MWSLIWVAAFTFAQSDVSKKPLEIPFDPAKVIYKTKSPQIGPLEILCEQRVVSPHHEIIMSYRVNENHLRVKHELTRLTTYNTCNSYKFKLSKGLRLTMTSSPGGRNDEPGAKVTLTYIWEKPGRLFVGGEKVEYSPFKELQAQYRKILATAAIPKAEKLVLANRKKVEAYRGINAAEAQGVCEDFYNAYKVYGDNLFKEKDYKQAFDIYLSLHLKFGDPQNLFYNALTKNDKMLLVCQAENANNDQSEDQFYIFAKRYLNKIEFIPFMLQKIQRSLKQNTEASNELATQILKYLSFLMKSASRDEQLQFQNQIIQAWSQIVKGNAEHPYYERLLEEDTHLVFLMAEAKRCGAIPKNVLDRMPQKDDDPELLKNMNVTVADDSYNEGLQKGAIYEYKQYVQSRVLLKKCDQIPKPVFERYFKFMREQPYQR